MQKRSENLPQTSHKIFSQCLIVNSSLLWVFMVQNFCKNSFSGSKSRKWVPVNHVLQLLSILTVNTSGRPYTFLKSEFKDTQKQFTENLWTWKHSFMHLPIEICPSTLNSLIIIGNFWKHLTLIHIKASFFVLYTVIPGYFNEFMYEIMKWNISKD